MIKHVGGRASVCSAADSLNHQARIILPGVGHFGSAIQRLKGDGWIAALEKARGQGVWMMGICLGMQLLGTNSEEHGLSNGLNLIIFFFFADMEVTFFFVADVAFFFPDNVKSAL